MNPCPEAPERTPDDDDDTNIKGGVHDKRNIT